MKTIALANQKGGVGKTTTAASLGIGLSRQGKKILLIDADAQGNLTQMLGWPQPDELSPTLSTLMEKIIAEQSIAPGEGSCRQIAATLNEEGVPTPATYCGWNMGRKGPYAGLWSSERIFNMLQNETYIGNMVQGRQVKISYKSKKCLHQDRNNWVVVEDTHEPLIDAESFRKVRMLVNSRKRTRSRTYDFLLKGLIFCHECGYPLGVLNRPNAKGEETLYFVCRTYGVMPLWRDNLHSCSHFSPDFFINILCSYVRLVLVNVLLVRTLAVWRVKREEKKADVILSK